MSKPTLFRARSGARAISSGTWAKLEAAERKAGITGTPANAQGESGRVEEGRAPYGQTQTAAFRDYLVALRELSQIARDLAAGDEARQTQIFDKLLDTWRETVAAKRRNSATPGGTSDSADLAKARELIAKYEATPLPLPVEPPAAQKHA